MRRRLLPIAAAFLVLLAAGPGFPHVNARFYRGEIVASASWEGVVRLTGGVVIREGVTVTVLPGTEVLVQPEEGAGIVVRGRLAARGLPGRPVVFDAAGGGPAARWGGIVFTRGATGLLEHVVVRRSATGIGGDLSGVERAAVSFPVDR